MSDYYKLPIIEDANVDGITHTKDSFKVKINGRDDLKIPSVVEIWPGANFQEREIWDLMGIQFENHPNLKRIMLWEGFPGHPHRKDFEDPVKY